MIARNPDIPESAGGKALWPTKERIVGEVATTWIHGDSNQVLLAERFEHLIEVNATRGYRVESWRTTAVPTRVFVSLPNLEAGGKFHDAITETIVAVFVRKEVSGIPVFGEAQLEKIRDAAALDDALKVGEATGIELLSEKDWAGRWLQRFFIKPYSDVGLSGGEKTMLAKLLEICAQDDDGEEEEPE